MLTTKKKKKVQVKETFVDFLQLKEKDAASIVNTICEKLEKDQLPLRDCCSQCYGNAAAMAGHVSGVQRRILDKNPNALFINCYNRSLNLACVHAASKETITFFFFESSKLFTNFSALLPMAGLNLNKNLAFLCSANQKQGGVLEIKQ